MILTGADFIVFDTVSVLHRDRRLLRLHKSLAFFHYKTAALAARDILSSALA